MEMLKNIEEFAQIKDNEKAVFMFTTTWCGDCHYIKPMMPEVEANFPEFTFMEVDRDKFMDLAQEWDIMGIPSFVAFEKGQVIGRFVSKDRKTQEEVEAFLTSIQS